MTIRITMQRGDNLAEATGLPAGNREIPFDESEGQWVQFWLNSLCDQSLKSIATNHDDGVWYTDDGEPWSDIIVTFEPDASPTDVPTWPETDAERAAYVDWQHEVANGDTLRGFREWMAWTLEAEAEFGDSHTAPAWAPTIDSVRVIFDLNENGEANGTVHPFCSDECRDAYIPEGEGIPNTAYGRSSVDDFGFVPKCEQCGKFVGCDHSFNGSEFRCDHCGIDIKEVP